jgi:hypothetical protein
METILEEEKEEEEGFTAETKTVLRIANRKKCNYERVYCGEFQIS